MTDVTNEPSATGHDTRPGTWHVVNTRPHQECRAELNLIRQGFRAWLPVMERSRRHARRIETIKAPVFPGYLFVQLDLETEPWSPINSTFGVKRLLADGLTPRLLATEFVAALRATLEADGTVTLASDTLSPGDTVRLTAGPFTDSVATVLKVGADDRVRVLLDILGRGVATTVPLRAVAPAA